MASSNPFVATLSNILVKFSQGKIRYGGDAQRGGKNDGDSIVSKWVRGRLHVMRGREKFGSE